MLQSARTMTNEVVKNKNKCKWCCKTQEQGEKKVKKHMKNDNYGC
jgi:hypothetical protein